MTWEKEIKEIKKREKMALKQGGKQSVTLHHKKGRKTLRERLEIILDNKSFQEIGKISGDAEYNENGELKNFTPANFLLAVPKSPPEV